MVQSYDPEIQSLVLQLLTKFFMWACGTFAGIAGPAFIIWWKWWVPRQREKEDKRQARAASQRAHGYAEAECEERKDVLVQREADERRMRSLEHRTKALEESRERISERLSQIDQAGYIARAQADDILEKATAERHREDDATNRRLDRLEAWRDRLNGSGH